MENEYRIKPFAEWFVGRGWKRNRAVNHMKIHGSFVREQVMSGTAVFFML